MHQPLSRRKRLFYLIVFILLFVILIPVVAFYSLGYRFTKNWQIERTGGIYVYSTDQGASIYLDGTLNRQTNFFVRGVFISDLTPRTYQIEVTRASSTSWKKTVTVLSEQVTEAYPFLLPLDPGLATVTPTVVDSSGATVTNSQYTGLVALFKLPNNSPVKTLATSTAATTSPEALAIPRQNIKIWKQNNTIFAEWMGQSQDSPFYFCKNVGMASTTCESTITVYQAPYIGTVDFYPGRNDVVLFSTKDGIYATELDNRPPQNIDPLILGSNIDFREVSGDQLFIKNSAGIYQVNL